VSALGVVPYLGDEHLSVGLTKKITLWLPMFNFDMVIQKATSRLAHLEMLRLNSSSSSFAIRVNLLHPLQSLFLYGLLLSLWYFSILVNHYF